MYVQLKKRLNSNIYYYDNNFKSINLQTVNNIIKSNNNKLT